MSLATEGINCVAVHGGGGVGAALVKVRVGRARVGMFPKHFAGIGVEAVDRFGVVHIAQRVSATVADRDGRKAGAYVRFPELLRSLLRPRGGPAGFFGDAVEVGSAPARPVVGGGWKRTDGAKKQGS